MQADLAALGLARTALIEPECRGFSISGQKGIYSNVTIDGGDYDSTWGCGIRARSESAPSFGLEAETSCLTISA